MCRLLLWVFFSLSRGTGLGARLSLAGLNDLHRQAPAQFLSQPAPSLIPLTVPAGTPLKVDLDQEVRVQKVGQPVHGKTVEPVYAFDKLVVPAGTEVVGKISAIDRVPKTRRTVAAMNGEFSPSRQVHIDFSELVMADGRHVPLQTDVSPGSGGVLQFVPAGEKEKLKNGQEGPSQERRFAKDQRKPRRK